MRVIAYLLVTLLSLSVGDKSMAVDSQQDSQLIMLKTLYDMPLDRLEEMYAQKTSAEVAQIKANEYLRCETEKNMMNSQSLSQAQKDQIYQMIKSEKEFDYKLETIRQRKLKTEHRANRRGLITVPW